MRPRAPIVFPETGEQMMLRTGMMMTVGLVCVSRVMAGTTGFKDDGARWSDPMAELR